jgi:hypothetical protein
VAKLLPALVTAGAIERDERGSVLRVRGRLLLERWTQDYSFTASNTQVSWLLAPRGIDDALARIPPQTPVAVTGSLAARRILPEGVVPVAPLVLAAGYTDNPAALAQAMGLVPSAQGIANVVLARPRDTTLLQSTAPRTQQPICVPTPQVLADLLTLPGRSTEEAEHVMDILARTDPRWIEEDEQ